MRYAKPVEGELQDFLTGIQKLFPSQEKDSPSRTSYSRAGRRNLAHLWLQLEE